MSSSTFATYAELGKSTKNNYNVKTLEQLLYTNSLFTHKPIEPVLKFVFLTQSPEEEKSGELTQFSNQLKTLNNLRRELNATHACFIATEPSSVEVAEQLIVGVITDAALLIVNPLGGVAPSGFYDAMKKTANLFTQKLYLSSFPLQKDSADLSSAGMICTELGRHFSEMTANEINTALTNSQSTDKTIYGLQYAEIDISKTDLLPEKTLRKLVIAANKSTATYDAVLQLLYPFHSKLLKQIEGDIYYDESLLTTIITSPEKNYHQDDRYPRLASQISIAAQPSTTRKLFPPTRYVSKESDMQQIALGPDLLTENTTIGPKGTSYPIQYVSETSKGSPGKKGEPGSISSVPRLTLESNENKRTCSIQ